MEEEFGYEKTNLNMLFLFSKFGTEPYSFEDLEGYISLVVFTHSVSYSKRNHTKISLVPCTKSDLDSNFYSSD